MLTAEENEFFTRVGPGTPAGEWLRRYWHPIAPVRELTDERPTKFVRLLGEDLVLFKVPRADSSTGNPESGTRNPTVGLLTGHCAHRGASLLYGRVEERGIACAYHGWLYDVEGNCLETPAEPADSLFHLTVKQRAYPVQRFCGLYWAYLGPPPAPLIPPYDIYSREDGVLKVAVYPRLDCNWLQPMENTADPMHADILHQEFLAHGRKLASTTRGVVDRVDHLEFYECPYGLVKKRVFKDGCTDEHPLVFPYILRDRNAMQFRVPMDDTHTSIFFILYIPADVADGPRDLDDPEVVYVEPFKDPPSALYPGTRFRWDSVLAQDHMAWETQGPIADRTQERLATSDAGIVLFRRMLKREIEKVQRGEDPIAVVRDPNHPMIDTWLDHTITEGLDDPSRPRGYYARKREALASSGTAAAHGGATSGLGDYPAGRARTTPLV